MPGNSRLDNEQVGRCSNKIISCKRYGDTMELKEDEKMGLATIGIVAICGIVAYVIIYIL